MVDILSVDSFVIHKGRLSVCGWGGCPGEHINFVIGIAFLFVH